MAVSITRLSWWLWGGKDEQTLPSGSSLNNSTSDFGLGLRDVDTVKFASVKGGKVHSAPTRRSKLKWNSREERKIDREHEVVLVPSDGGYLSGSDSDDSDWSIGWVEPHAPDFQSDDETESSFAVLVPCYGCGRRETVENPNNRISGVIGTLPMGTLLMARSTWNSGFLLFRTDTNWLCPTGSLAWLIWFTFIYIIKR